MPGCRNDEPVKRPLIDTVATNNMGVNIHFYEGTEKDWRMIKEAGINLVRMDVNWSGVEKERGIYDFSNMDKLFEKLSQNRMRVLLILNYGNKLYDDGNAPYTDEGREAFARFVKALAERYKNNDIIWELWNEPNLNKFWRPQSNVDDYMKWSRKAVSTIRLVDPDALIVGPASSTIDFGFLEPCFRQGFLDLVDGITVHPYRGPNRNPETANAECQLLKALIEKYKPANKTISVLSGEWGYNTTVMTRKTQGKFLPRQWLANLSAGVPFSIWYDWHDDGKDPDEPEHNFGTVTWDYQPKPAYSSMKQLFTKLKGYKFLTTVDAGKENDHVLLFENNGEFKIAFWTTGQKHVVTIDLTGGSNFLDLPLTDMPDYVSLPSDKVWWALVSKKISNMSSEEADKIVHTVLTGNTPNNELANLLSSGISAGDRIGYSLLMQLSDKVSPENALKIYHFILKSNAGIKTKKYAVKGVMVIGSEDDMDDVKSMASVPGLEKDVSNCLVFRAYDLAEKGEKSKAKEMLMLGIKGSPAVFFVNRTVELLEMSKDETDELREKAGFVASWNVAGPFPYRGCSDIESMFTVKSKTDQVHTYKGLKGDVKWGSYSAKDIWGIVPLAGMFGRIKATAYLYTEISAENAGTALLKIGSNDGVVCWVNGKKVHENYTGRPLVVDNDIVKVDLKKGINKILLKILNDGNNWEACLRIQSPNSIRITYPK